MCEIIMNYNTISKELDSLAFELGHDPLIINPKPLYRLLNDGEKIQIGDLYYDINSESKWSKITKNSKMLNRVYSRIFYKPFLRKV